MPIDRPPELEEPSFPEPDAETLPPHQEMELPPSYSTISPQLQKQDFVLRYSEGKLEAFPSERSMMTYEYAKKHARLGKNHPYFIRAKTFQSQSVGLPLLIAERCKSLGFGEQPYLDLFTCKPIPMASDKVFVKGDERKSAQVLVKTFSTYRRYTIQLKSKKIVVFAHLNSPIVDLQIDRQRFRFIKTLEMADTSHRYLQHSYKIYLLDPLQPSLTDNIDSSSEVHENNPLLGNKKKGRLDEPPEVDEQPTYHSPYEYGCLKFSPLGLNRRCATLSLYSQAAQNFDSNNSVDFTSFTFVAVSLILQTLEEDALG
ncbi:hypothetical protein JCM33374_g4099 [Metschnikowia sp. JCM 33374]|nr:hypothetical protein JCM33374_g4099 [Metschnikowia sp. JCM 33374]